MNKFLLQKEMSSDNLMTLEFLRVKLFLNINH